MTASIWPGLRPMLATPGTGLPDGPDWSFEVKWDGIRGLARVVAADCQVRSRNGVDLAGRFPGLAEAGAALADPAGELILDGECVAFDAAGQPSFPDAMRAGAAVTFIAFDLLALRGQDLRTQPLADRRAALAALDLQAATAGRWRCPEAFSDGPALLAATADAGLEGVVAKRLGSRYQAGVRSRDWLKFPHRATTDLIVVGYVRAESGTGASSLLVASPQGQLLGSVGSGITAKLGAEVAAELDSAARADPPPGLDFDQVDPAGLAKRFGARLRWSDPVAVATVSHLGHTSSNALRQPTLVRLRWDITPAEAAPDWLAAPSPAPRPAPTNQPTAGPADGPTGNVVSSAGEVVAAVAGRQLRLTNLDKVLWPATGTTKAELIEYMTAVSEPLLAQLAMRPITRRRWPHGVTDLDFFEKAVPKGAPSWLGRVGLRRSPGSHSWGTGGDARAPRQGQDRAEQYTGYIDYPLLSGAQTDVAALVWFAQSGVLELHTPQWRVKRRAQFGVPGPVDRMVLDLDPGPPAGLAECALVALTAREILGGAGFAPIPVASGSKGLHLYVHLREPLPAADVMELAEVVAAGLATAMGDLVVRTMARANRAGRVYLDINQNLATRTTITPYSPRGRELPTVATPLLWQEVADGVLAPATIHTMPERLARLGDLMRQPD